MPECKAGRIAHVGGPGSPGIAWPEQAKRFTSCISMLDQC